MLGSAAPAELLQLLCESSNPATVSGCVAAVNNLCATEEGLKRIFEEAKRVVCPLPFCRERQNSISIQCITDF